MARTWWITFWNTLQTAGWYECQNTGKCRTEVEYCNRGNLGDRFSVRDMRPSAQMPSVSGTQASTAGLLILQYCIGIGSIANTVFSIARVLQYFF